MGPAGQTAYDLENNNNKVIPGKNFITSLVIPLARDYNSTANTCRAFCNSTISFRLLETMTA